MRTQIFLTHGQNVFVQGLASKLSVKFAPDKFPLLNNLYKEAFEYASTNDNDGVSLKLQPT